MKDLAQTDERARVFNRRYAVNFLSNAEANQRRNQLPYCVCICDLDKFIDGDRLLSASIGIAEPGAMTILVKW